MWDNDTGFRCVSLPSAARDLSSEYLEGPHK